VEIGNNQPNQASPALLQNHPISKPGRVNQGIERSDRVAWTLLRIKFARLCGSGKGGLREKQAKLEKPDGLFRIVGRTGNTDRRDKGGCPQREGMAKPSMIEVINLVCYLINELPMMVKLGEVCGPIAVSVIDESGVFEFFSRILQCFTP
jgi:hypothetical protein